MAQAVDYEKLYSLIGYRFRNEKLIKTALTHSSYASEHKLGYERNNERLEFIGDAYVDAVEKKTWLRNDITPYEIYLKTLYEIATLEDSRL